MLNKLHAFHFCSSNNVTDTDQRTLCLPCTVNRLHRDCTLKKYYENHGSSNIMVIKIELKIFETHSFNLQLLAKELGKVQKLNMIVYQTAL